MFDTELIKGSFIHGYILDKKYKNKRRADYQAASTNDVTRLLHGLLFKIDRGSD
jgi:hypothetical protein